MSKIESFKYNVGLGCPCRVSALPEHNPEPRTDRGRRRHDKRSADEKKKAEAAWARDRSTQPSRYQRYMTSAGLIPG